MTALAIVVALVAGAAIAFAWWISRRTLAAMAQTGVDAVALAQARARIDDQVQTIDDRDRALTAKQAELDRVLASKLVTDRQLADARALCETLARGNPAALGSAVRAQLERVRALAQPRVPDDPAAAAGAGAADHPGDGPVLAPAAAGAGPGSKPLA